MSSPRTERPRGHALRAVVMVCSAAAGCTSPDYATPPAPLLERMWVAPSLDARDSLIYEAQVAANLFLADNLLERERDLRVDQGTLWRRAHRFLVTPMFRIRQLSDSSAAVRTPSFMPSLRFEQHFLRADTIARTPGSFSRELRHFDDVGYRVEWSHHSNGQAGCFRAGYLPAPSGEPDDCTPAADADTSRVNLNRASGDFSTTYWGVTGFVRRVGVSANQEERWAAELGLGYQLHRWGIFGDMRDEQRALYGTHRGRVDARVRRVFGPVQGRIEALYELAEHTDPRIVPWRGHVDVSVRSPRTLGTGLFVRFLDGQDYYNIGFAKRRTRTLFGILIDPSALESPR